MLIGINCLSINRNDFGGIFIFSSGIWQKFITWVDRRVVKEGTFEKFKAWGDARAEYFVSENRLTGTFRFDVRLMQSGHAGTLVWEKAFSSSLPQRLARKWIINLNS